MPNRELALDMWAAGALAWQIADAADYADERVVMNAIYWARRKGDPRAARRRGHVQGPPKVRPRVLALVERGLTSIQIGERLGISPGCARVHIAEARKRGELASIDKKAQARG